jgi:hypothetical protein
MKVLLPQPDGPMNAVTSFLRMSSETSASAGTPAYATIRSLTSKTTSPERENVSSRSATGRTAGTFTGRAAALSMSDITISSGSGF